MSGAAMGRPADRRALIDEIKAAELERALLARAVAAARAPGANDLDAQDRAGRAARELAELAETMRREKEATDRRLAELDGALRNAGRG